MTEDGYHGTSVILRCLKQIWITTGSWLVNLYLENLFLPYGSIYQWMTSWWTTNRLDVCNNLAQRRDHTFGIGDFLLWTGKATWTSKKWSIGDIRACYITGYSLLFIVIVVTCYGGDDKGGYQTANWSLFSSFISIIISSAILHKAVRPSPAFILIMSTRRWEMRGAHRHGPSPQIPATQ